MIFRVLAQTDPSNSARSKQQECISIHDCYERSKPASENRSAKGIYQNIAVITNMMIGGRYEIN